MNSRHQIRGDRDRGGFAALELAILLPFVVVMLLLVVAFGRVERGRELVDRAAASAARAASLHSSPGSARTAAIDAAKQTLGGHGVSCSSYSITVDLSAFHAGGSVTVELTCVADLSDLTLTGVPGHLTLRAATTSALEPYRQVDTGASR
jgi:Flp pilus assembly protein TadG